MKFKKKLENRVEKSCYLRRIGTGKYQVWMPKTNKVTKIRTIDFILQLRHTNKPFTSCNTELDGESMQGSDEETARDENKAGKKSGAPRWGRFEEDT